MDCCAVHAGQASRRMRLRHLSFRSRPATLCLCAGCMASTAGHTAGQGTADWQRPPHQLSCFSNHLFALCIAPVPPPCCIPLLLPCLCCQLSVSRLPSCGFMFGSEAPRVIPSRSSSLPRSPAHTSCSTAPAGQRAQPHANCEPACVHSRAGVPAPRLPPHLPSSAQLLHVCLVGSSQGGGGGGRGGLPQRLLR